MASSACQPDVSIATWLSTSFQPEPDQLQSLIFSFELVILLCIFHMKLYVKKILNGKDKYYLGGKHNTLLVTVFLLEVLKVSIKSLLLVLFR